MTQLQTRANTLLSAHGKQIQTKLKKKITEKVSLKDKNRLSTTSFASLHQSYCEWFQSSAQNTLINWDDLTTFSLMPTLM